MAKNFILTLFLMFTSIAYANDNVEISCTEFKELTGDELPCDITPTLKVSSDQLKQARSKAAKRECVKQWEAQYGHCKQYSQTDYLTDKAPKECYQNSNPSCDQQAETTKPSKPKTQLW